MTHSVLQVRYKWGGRFPLVLQVCDLCLLIQWGRRGEGENRSELVEYSASSLDAKRPGILGGDQRGRGKEKEEEGWQHT